MFAHRCHVAQSAVATDEQRSSAQRGLEVEEDIVAVDVELFPGEGAFRDLQAPPRFTGLVAGCAVPHRLSLTIA